MTRRNVRGKTALITGATGGLGRAMSLRFGEAGATIVGIDLNRDSLDSLKEELREKHITFTGYECDVTDWDKTRETAEQMLQEMGGVDFLINNAGISHLSRFRDTDLLVYRKVMEINFFGSLHWTKVCLDSLIERKGMIIALSSVAGIAPLIGRSGYSASKHALHGLLETLRTEVPEIKVMMACPSFVDTGINKNTLGKDGGQASQKRLHVGKKISAQEAAEMIFQGAIRERELLMVGGTGRIAYWVHKFFPSLYCRMMVRNLKGELES